MHSSAAEYRLIAVLVALCGVLPDRVTYRACGEASRVDPGRIGTQIPRRDQQTDPTEADDQGPSDVTAPGAETNASCDVKEAAV
jgi:hypothetical protein